LSTRFCRKNDKSPCAKTGFNGAIAARSARRKGLGCIRRWGGEWSVRWWPGYPSVRMTAFRDGNDPPDHSGTSHARHFNFVRATEFDRPEELDQSDPSRGAPGDRTGPARAFLHPQFGGEQPQCAYSLDGQGRSTRPGGRLAARRTPHQGCPHGRNSRRTPAALSAHAAPRYPGTARPVAGR